VPANAAVDEDRIAMARNGTLIVGLFSSIALGLIQAVQRATFRRAKRALVNDGKMSSVELAERLGRKAPKALGVLMTT
jgi:hypothetical protein